MSITINSNIAATSASLSMKRAGERLSKSLMRLSSGQRIVSPADDAGGLAVGMKLQSSLRRATASMHNTQNGISFLQMQDSVLKIVGDIVDRMSELKSFYNDVSKNEKDRETYNHEFHELQKELGSLKGQKFNGVSLFASLEPDNNPLKIITSDDGKGDHIELNRLGLFENMKSRYGADGELNTGASGSFRQLIGDFVRDGGTTDTNPGHTSMDFAKGSVVYKSGGLASDSGYFMALTDLKAGVKIADTASPTTQWIRLADSQGNGFAEAYPSSPEFDPYSLKYNSKGDKVAYLKDDVIKVPAHWASPGSYLFLKAEVDVPQGMSLNDIFSKGSDGKMTNIGNGKYFSFVGEDSFDGAKPTTEYIRANINHPEPTYQSVEQVGGASISAANLIALLEANAANNYTPGYLKVSLNNVETIVAPSFNWDLSKFNDLASYNHGDIVFGDVSIFQMNSNVKGSWGAGSYNTGDYVQYDGKWHKVTGANGATSTDRPWNPDDNDTAGYNNQAYSTGDVSKTSDPANLNQIRIATDAMKGAFVSGQDYASGNVVWENSVFISIGNTAATQLSTPWSAGVHSTGAVVKHQNILYERTGGASTSADGNPADNGAGWTPRNSLSEIMAAGTADIVPSLTDVTALVESEARGITGTSIYFKDSPFQAYDTDGTTYIGNPTFGDTGTTEITDSYRNLNNSKYWSKTHYGALGGLTVNTSYQYGDNIHYQGKNYIYVSQLASDHHSFLDGADPASGYTEFDILKKLGAVIELPMYVDTVAGGGQNVPAGVYYKPGQNLEFVDRLSASGEVRTAGAERRTDAPLPPGDEIFGSADDQFYGGLNSGNDGIFGTADDYYASTIDPSVAKSGGQLDADADNNKDLLDTSNSLADFSVADFVDYIQSVANFRAVNGGTMSRLNYATNLLEENKVNLQAATSRIMDTDMALEASRMAQQQVLLQASASMVTQANQLNSIVLSLLQ